jgi:hypothetical protein
MIMASINMNLQATTASHCNEISLVIRPQRGLNHRTGLSSTPNSFFLVFLWKESILTRRRHDEILLRRKGNHYFCYRQQLSKISTRKNGQVLISLPKNTCLHKSYYLGDLCRDCFPMHPQFAKSSSFRGIIPHWVHRSRQSVAVLLIHAGGSSGLVLRHSTPLTLKYSSLTPSCPIPTA